MLTRVLLLVTVLTHRSVQRNGGTWTLGTGHSRCRGGRGRSPVSGVGSVAAVDWTDWSPPGLPGHWSHSPHQNCNDNKIMLKLCNNKSHHIKTVMTTINQKNPQKNVTMFMSKKSFQNCNDKSLLTVTKILLHLNCNDKNNQAKTVISLRPNCNNNKIMIKICKCTRDGSSPSFRVCVMLQ